MNQKRKEFWQVIAFFAAIIIFGALNKISKESDFYLSDFGKCFLIFLMAASFSAGLIYRKFFELGGWISSILIGLAALIITTVAFMFLVKMTSGFSILMTAS